MLLKRENIRKENYFAKISKHITLFASWGRIAIFVSSWAKSVVLRRERKPQGGNEAIGGSSSRKGSTIVDVEQRDFIDLEDHVLDPRPMDAYRKAYDGFFRPIVNQKDWNKVPNPTWKIIGIATPLLANHRGMVTLTLARGFHFHNQHHQVEDMVEGKEGMLEEKEEVEGMVEGKKVCMADNEKVCQCKEHKREHIIQDGGVGFSHTPPLQLQPTTKEIIKIFKEGYFG